MLPIDIIVASILHSYDKTHLNYPFRFVPCNDLVIASGYAETMKNKKITSWEGHQILGIAQKNRRTIMNPYLFNPAIISRAAHEREQELRRQSRGDNRYEQPAQPKSARSQTATQRRYFTFFAWLYARATR